MSRRRATTKGFTRTASLLTGRIRAASETRGFAQSRLLTDWQEIAGKEVAAVCRPVEISYGRGGLGATLTLLTTGAQAPMLEMQKDKLRDRVNSVYGYAAISRIRITQTAASGFSEGRAHFEHRSVELAEPTPDPADKRRADEAACHIADESLRTALAQLGANIFSKNNR